MTYDDLLDAVRNGQAVEIGSDLVTRSPGIRTRTVTVQDLQTGALWTASKGWEAEQWSLPAHEAVAQFAEFSRSWAALDRTRLEDWIAARQAVDAVETMLGVKA